MALPGFLRKIVGWLRAGYPEGVPSVDYIPLFALLGSQLTEDEVRAIAAELEDSAGPDTAEAIRAAIKSVTHARSQESDIARVRARLAAGGWPLAPPQRISEWPLAVRGVLAAHPICSTANQTGASPPPRSRASFTAVRSRS